MTRIQKTRIRAITAGIVAAGLLFSGLAPAEGLAFREPSRSTLAPAMRLAPAVIVRLCRDYADKGLPESLFGQGYPGRAAQSLPADAAAVLRQKQALLLEVQRELLAPNTGKLPRATGLSDFHGQIDLFLNYIADIISIETGKKITLDDSCFPQKPIRDQLSEQGVDIAELQRRDFRMYLLGDVSDKGRYGIKCSRAVEELKTLGLAEVVLGNHDLLELMDAMGFHLPIYKGYNLYGHEKSRQLVERHWDDPEIARDRVRWWSVKLAEFVKERKAMQSGTFNLHGAENIKDVREHFKQMYLQIQGQLDEDEKVLWEDLVGFFFGATDVTTGFNDVGMMSVEWWQERADTVGKYLQNTRQKIHRTGTGRMETRHQIAIWEELKEYTDEALRMVQEKSIAAKQQGKWWHQVFNDINHQAYMSPEWYAIQWLFYKGWGTSVIAELNELESDKQRVWDAANFMDNQYIKDFAAFSRKNFTLYCRDQYGNYYTHGWFPIDMDTGKMGFTYKGVRYEGKEIWTGLDVVQNDVRDEGNSLASLQEAFSLVMSWYADKTVKIKPQHIAEYIRKFGIRAIQEQIGAGIWFTCHNPLNTLLTKGIKAIEQEGDYVHVFVDKGMSWQKFKDLGGYVVADARGVKLRGFSGVDFREIIDNPPVVILSQEKDSRGEEWIVSNRWDTGPLAAPDFLRIVEQQLEMDIAGLQRLLAPRPPGPLPHYAPRIVREEIPVMQAI